MIDFSFKGSQRYYIQSALNIDKESKREQETLSLNKINDSFKKIELEKDSIFKHIDKNNNHRIYESIVNSLKE